MVLKEGEGGPLSLIAAKVGRGGSGGSEPPPLFNVVRLGESESERFPLVRSNVGVSSDAGVELFFLDRNVPVLPSIKVKMSNSKRTGEYSGAGMGGKVGSTFEDIDCALALFNEDFDFELRSVFSCLDRTDPSRE